MSSAEPKAHLTTVRGSFHGHVLAARLGSEGIGVELRGMNDGGPYPLPANVDVYVRADQLELARALLLADAVDAAFAAGYDLLGEDGSGSLDLPPPGLAAEPLRHRRTKVVLVIAMVAVVLIFGIVAAYH
jgi:hypothetical protein